MTSQTVLLYLLKTILISGLFAAYYWMALRDKKFHYYNRFYLLSASVISLMAPLLNFDWFSVEESVLYGSPVLYGSSNLIRSVLPTTTGYNGIHLDWADYVLITAGIITIALLGLLIMHIIKIQLLKRKWEVTKMEGFDFINTNEDNAPFSFLNNLFWKQSISLQEEGGQQIFKHEITHIQQKHTWDRIYCQLVASLFWMNPFNWIIQKELVAIHEFIADEEAVGNSNVEAFAKMLLQTHYGNHFLNPSHSFFYSSIKRRLAMLTKSNNTKYSYLRRVMVLPVIIAAVCIVSIKVHASERIENKVEEIKNNISLLMSDTTKPKSENKLLAPPPPSPSLETPNYYINGVKLAEGAPPPPPLTNPAYYLDGVKINEKEMKDISINGIASINVLKGGQALKKYPADGKNGIVEIISKDKKSKEQQRSDLNNIIFQDKTGLDLTEVRSLVLVNGVKVDLKGADGKNEIINTPLYVLNGVPIKSVNDISPKDIETINVLKSPSSISLYGDAGKNGVILITTKKGLGNLYVQNKMEEVTVTGYGTKLGIPSVQNIKKPYELEEVAVVDNGAKAGSKENLQNKVDEVTVIGFSNKSKQENEEESVIFNAPKIQKNVDPSKNNEPIFYTAEKPAQFQGGSKGWVEYLGKNLNRDLLYKNKAVVGKYTVKLNFVVTSNGDVVNVIAENNPGYGSASEAIRVIEQGPKWIPAEQNGKKVNYLIKQTIVFEVSDK
jgi:TonB-dependent SusC/RagA subfamily outer membrane receptor